MRSPAKIEHGVRCCASRNVLKCHGCPYQGGPCCREQLLKDVQDYLKAIRKCGARIEQQVKQLEAAQPKWISVEERLPEDYEQVLVYIASEKEGVDSVIAITNYTHNMHGFNIKGWVSPWQYCFWGRKVTHWMPLPSAPKEEA